MNPDRINTGVTAGNFELESVLKDMARNMGAPLITGNVYFVIPTGNDNYVQFEKYFNKKYEDGTDLVQTSLNDALTAVTANRGDFIFLANGFALTVTDSNTDLNKAGVTIVGLGNGLKRPTFTFGAAAATIDVTAANIKVLNVHHIADFLDVASAYTLAAAKDFEIDKGSFDDNTSTKNFLSIVTTSAVDQAAEGLTVVNNKWNGLNTTPLAFVSILAALDRLTLNNNKVFMDATNDVGHFVTLADKIILEAEIDNNRLIIVGATDAAVGIFLTGSGSTSKGIVSNNFVSSLDTGGELIATDGTGLDFFENYYTGVANKSGKLWPVVDVA